MSKQTKITTFFKSSIDSISGEKFDSKDIKLLNEEKTQIVVNNKKRKLSSIDDKSVVNDNKRGFKGYNKFSRNTPKVCPFYKKIPNTRFVVDAFSYGSIPDISVYFLTHFHSDHFMGLNNSFNQQIYCSKITASLVRNKFKSGLFSLNIIEINSSKDVMGVRVTFFEANHCPGAVVILFELKNGLRYLHTGDFRADHSFFQYKQLICKPIDTIFLDTTYCDPKYDFLPQKQILETIVSISSDYYKKNPKLLIVCGSYSIGKENVFISIATALSLKVWTNDTKREIYKCYKNSRIDSILVSNKSVSRLHVLSMNSINESFLKQYIKESNGLYNEVLAFRPTGWEHNKNSVNGVKTRKYDNITICGIEYSEHSSFTELQRFVSFFKPKRVIPTVNNSNQITRNQMNALFNQWINCCNDSPDITVIPNKPKINGSITNWLNKNNEKSTEESDNHKEIQLN